MKGQRCNLLRNAGSLKEEQAVRLDALLDANASLHTASVLKEAFRHLWSYTP